jgi:proline dehydrogenase
MNDTTERLVRKANEGLIWLLTSNRPGLSVFNALAEPYLSGHSLEEGMLRVVKEYEANKRHSTIDILGESSFTAADANRYVLAYEKILGMIPSRQMASISVKPSAICAVTSDGTRVLPETPLIERLERLVMIAARKGIDVTLDMEDHHWTDTSLEAADNLWAKGYKNFGIVLQSRLDRTQSDIERLRSASRHYRIPLDSIRVRAVIGIYNEPESMATNKKSAAKKRLVERAGELFDAGFYVEIATHDNEVVSRIIEEVIETDGITSNRWELQGLQGVDKTLGMEEEVVERGSRIRIYRPIEINRGDGLPYMKRRCRANPSLAVSIAAGFVRRF